MVPNMETTIMSLKILLTLVVFGGILVLGSLMIYYEIKDNKNELW